MTGRYTPPGRTIKKLTPGRGGGSEAELTNGKTIQKLFGPRSLDSAGSGMRVVVKTFTVRVC